MAAQSGQSQTDTGSAIDGKIYVQSTQRIKTVLNATALSQNLALLITVLKDGETQLFYKPLLILLALAIIIQVIVAIVIIWYSTIPSHNICESTCIQLQKFNRILMMISTVSMMLNISVNIIFSARGDSVPMTKQEL
jgi:uncharacterized membrane protein